MIFLFKALTCKYNEWQCGNECIRKYETCNGTCPLWYWKCPHRFYDCVSYSSLCDGYGVCEDGSDERNCPKNCSRKSVESYIEYDGIVSCKGHKVCAGDPCGDICFRYRCVVNKEFLNQIQILTTHNLFS